MIKKLLLIASAALALANGVPSSVDAQVTWGYSFQPSGQALATYLGDVQINGACTGCTTAGEAFLGVPQTWTALQTFSAGIAGTNFAFATGQIAGSASALGLTLPNIGETTTITTLPAAVQTYDVLTASVDDYATAATANWTLNIRGNAGASLNSVMTAGQTVTIAMITTQGATPFFNNVVQIDGTTVTPKWQGGAPSAGNPNGLDVYTYTIIKTANATYTVLASQVQFR